jgi:hypothetical protein
MPEWPKEPKQLGKEHVRYDGPVKVSGRAKYASDMQPAGWLYGMILRSEWPAAGIRTIWDWHDDAHRNRCRRGLWYRAIRNHREDW